MIFMQYLNPNLDIENALSSQFFLKILILQLWEGFKININVTKW